MTLKVYSAARTANTQRLRVLVKEQKGRCYYCQSQMAKPNSKELTRATADHRIPVVLGGGNGYRNLVAACHRCNTLKGALTEAEFSELRRDERALKKARDARHAEIVAAKEAQRHPRRSEAA
jgi:5-methylcytosine-specific restriction endonuclease McrA